MSIRIAGLTKSYGTHKAIDNITFSVDKGEIVGFLGPNGSGKSTTMRCMLDLDRPVDAREKLEAVLADPEYPYQPEVLADRMAKDMKEFAKVIPVPTERSMPPVMITKVTPIARTPFTAVATRIEM